MKILKWLAGIAVAIVLVLVAAFVAAGLMIPAERSFTNEVEINAPADKVWQVLTDRTRYAEWQNKIERVEPIDEKNWIEYAKDAPEPLRFSVVTDERPQRMELRYTMGETYEGRWTGEVTPMTTGVKLRTTDTTNAKDWFTKVFTGLFFDLDSFAKDWNSKLKARVESSNN